jgi:hypothetical protein
LSTTDDRQSGSGQRLTLVVVVDVEGDADDLRAIAPRVAQMVRHRVLDHETWCYAHAAVAAVAECDAAAYTAALHEATQRMVSL